MLTCFQKKMHDVVVTSLSCSQECICQVILLQSRPEQECNAANVALLGCSLP
jgi:hypothetical protein